MSTSFNLPPQFMDRMDQQAAKKDFKLTEDINRIAESGKQAGLNDDEIRDIQFGRVQQEFGPSFNRGDFNFLLSKLTGSKIRQNRDAQAQERQNIYARGLSSMFSNF